MHNPLNADTELESQHQMPRMSLGIDKVKACREHGLLPEKAQQNIVQEAQGDIC